MKTKSQKKVKTEPEIKAEKYFKILDRQLKQLNKSAKILKTINQDWSLVASLCHVTSSIQDVINFIDLQ